MITRESIQEHAEDGLPTLEQRVIVQIDWFCMGKATLKAVMQDPRQDDRALYGQVADD